MNKLPLTSMKPSHPMSTKVTLTLPNVHYQFHEIPTPNSPQQIKLNAKHRIVQKRQVKPKTIFPSVSKREKKNEIGPKFCSKTETATNK